MEKYFNYLARKNFWQLDYTARQNTNRRFRGFIVDHGAVAPVLQDMYFDPLVVRVYHPVFPHPAARYFWNLIIRCMSW
jgi:hypothetical protein